MPPFQQGIYGLLPRKQRYPTPPRRKSQGLSLFVAWLYRGFAPGGNNQPHFVRLHKLYTFAEKCCLFDLASNTINQIHGMAVKYEEAKTTAELVGYVR
jgi:hypothetical protein